MSLVAVLGRRIIRLSPITGLVIGAEYALGGFTFDTLFFMPPTINLGERSRRLYLLISSAISGSLAIVPYLLFRFSVLSLNAFLALTPYTSSPQSKALSSASLGLSILPRIKAVLKPIA